MSLQAIVWAWKNAPADTSPSQLLTLLALADDANDDWLAWPKRSTIAKKIRGHEETVRLCLRWLEDEGLIKCYERFWLHGRQTSNVYWLTGGPIKPSELDPDDLPRGVIKGMKTGEYGIPPSNFGGSKLGDKSNGGLPPRNPGGSGPRNPGGSGPRNPGGLDPSREIPQENRPERTTVVREEEVPSFERTNAYSNGRDFVAEAWLRFREEYPRRLGEQGNIEAEVSFDRLCRQRKGMADYLVEQARWYKKYCEAIGREGTEFVVQMSTFLGPRKKKWKTDWKAEYEAAKKNGLQNGKRRMGGKLPEGHKFQTPEKITIVDD